MPVEKELKTTYQSLYEDHQPLKALQQCDAILKQSPGNLMATIYKATALEKLYFGFADWHNDQTLDNARDLLSQALSLAQNRGDRSKIALVYFRHFVHYFNSKKYQEAREYMDKCKHYGYNDDTLPMWEYQLDKKLKKLAKKDKSIEQVKASDVAQVKPPASAVNTAAASVDANVSQPVSTKETVPRFRTDWYQTRKTVVLSIFTANLPQSKESVTLQVSPQDKRYLELSFQCPNTESEFHYEVNLAHEVNPSDVKLNVFTKKLEITLAKLVNLNWKTLESSGDSDNISGFTEAVPQGNGKSTKESLGYPSSSKRQIDWSKVDLKDEEDEIAGSADAFFQKLYAGADPDTQRAMMKSYIESNGTALNTNWEDVSRSPVEISPPEGTELKRW